MMENFKIVLKDNFEREYNPPQFEQYQISRAPSLKERWKSNRRKISCEKESLNKQIEHDFMKINSLALVKKGSFKVSYFEDFTIELPKNDHNSQIYSQSSSRQTPNCHSISNITQNSPSTYGYKKIINNFKQYNHDLILKMRTEGSQNILYQQQNQQYSNIQQDYNVYPYQKIMNSPTTPSNQWGLSNFNNIYINDCVKINSPHSFLEQDDKNEKIQQDIEQSASRKKIRSLPPIKSRSNASPECSPLSSQISIKSQGLKNKRRYQYLFDSKNMTQNQINESVKNPLINIQDGLGDMSLEQIFKGKNNSFQTNTQQSVKNKKLQNKVQNPLFQVKRYKTPTKNYNDLTNRSNIQYSQDISNSQPRYSDIKCISSKSYISPNKIFKQEIHHS